MCHNQKTHSSGDGTYSIMHTFLCSNTVYDAGSQKECCRAMYMNNYVCVCCIEPCVTRSNGTLHTCHVYGSALESPDD